MLRQRRGERGHRFRVEARAGGVLDRQTIGAQEQHGLDAVARGEALNDLSQWHHGVVLRGSGKCWRNVGTAPVEVKK